MDENELLILTTEINVRTGPTIVGKENSDPELMKLLHAKISPSNSALGELFYESPDDISTVMCRAKRLGYKIVSTTGLGQTFIVVMEKS